MKLRCVLRAQRSNTTITVLSSKREVRLVSEPLVRHPLASTRLQFQRNGIALLSRRPWLYASLSTEDWWNSCVIWIFYTSYYSGFFFTVYPDSSDLAALSRWLATVDWLPGTVVYHSLCVCDQQLIVRHPPTANTGMHRQYRMEIPHSASRML